LKGIDVKKIPKEIQEKAKLEGKLEVAKKVLAKGLSMEDVVEISGLSAEQIKGEEAVFTETVGGLLVKKSDKKKPTKEKINRRIVVIRPLE